MGKNGEPISEAVITLVQDGHEPWRGPRTERPRRIDTVRSVSIPSSPAVSTGWRSPPTVRPEPGADKVGIGALDLEFVLQPESVLRGRVVDRSGRAVEIVGMSLARYEGRGVSSFSWDVETESDGRFRSSRPGSWRVQPHGLRRSRRGRASRP